MTETWQSPPTPFLDRAREAALARLAALGEAHLAELSRADRTILTVSSAQGVIDNGGFRYFFESDWPGQPPYSMISDAYRRIGAAGPAECIDRAVALFPFSGPEAREADRQAFLEAIPDDHELHRLGDQVCGDVTVWQLLEAYAREQSGH